MIASIEWSGRWISEVAEPWVMAAARAASARGSLAISS